MDSLTLQDLPADLLRIFSDSIMMRSVDHSLLERFRQDFKSKCFQDPIIHPELRGLFNIQHQKLPLQCVVMIKDEDGSIHLYQIIAELVEGSMIHHQRIDEYSFEDESPLIIQYHINEYSFMVDDDVLRIFKDLETQIGYSKDLRDMSLEIYEAIFENDSKPLGMIDVDVKTFFEVIESRNGDLLKHEIISLMISKLQSLKKDNIPTMLYVLSNAVVLGMLDFQEINELFEDSTNHVELKKYDIDLLNARVDRFGFWELRLFHEFTPNLNIKSIQMEHLSARRIINKYWDRLLQAIKDF